MRSFDEIYADVPPDQRDALRHFRDTHPEHTLDVNGVTWRYVVSGKPSAHPLLLLVGGLREADAAYANIAELDDDFRVIAPSYPTLDTMEALSDGIAAILRQECVSDVHVLAGSFGGMLAQVFIRRHADLIGKVVLSTTAVLDDANVQSYRAALQMMAALPDAQVLEGAKSTMFDIIQPPEDHHAFYRAYLDELFSYRVDKPALMSMYQALVGFAEGDALQQPFNGAMMVLESDDDANFDAETRARVRALYPQAQTYTFYSAGHSPATSQRELYFRVVKAFLRGEPVH